MQSSNNIFISENQFSLLAKYLQMETSAEENQYVEKWLQENPENVSVMLQVSEILFGSTDKVIVDTDRGWKNLQQHIDVPEKAVVVPLSSRKSRKQWWAAAAGIIVIMSLFIIYNLLNNNDNKTYYKDAASFKLKDGTKIELQKGAELFVSEQYNDKNRIVTLKGDGSFEVAKDSMRPFIINMDRRELTVVGTAFSIHQNSTKNYLHVKVTEGVVKVKDSVGGSMYKLIAGQELTLTDSSRVTKIFSPVENLKFDNRNFADILATIEKVYRIKIINKTPEINQLTYTVDLSSEPMDKALETLSTLTGLQIEQISEGVYQVK